MKLQAEADTEINMQLYARANITLVKEQVTCCAIRIVELTKPGNGFHIL